MRPTYSNLTEPDGTEVWLTITDQVVQEEKSEPVRCGPGLKEAHTSVALHYEIPGNSIVKDAFLDVWNDVEGTHYRMAVPLNVGKIHEKGPWFSTDVAHEYLQGKRVFRCHLENWSHTWGRWMQLNLKYERGTRAEDPRRA